MQIEAKRGPGQHLGMLRQRIQFLEKKIAGDPSHPNASYHQDVVVLAEITFAQKYHARTGHKVWTIDGHDARRTIYRLERMGGGR